MKTALVMVTLLTLVVGASIASADRGYSSYVQKAYNREIAEQVQENLASQRIAAEVERAMPYVVIREPGVAGTGWGTAAAAGAGTRPGVVVVPGRVETTYTCPSN